MRVATAVLSVALLVCGAVATRAQEEPLRPFIDEIKLGVLAHDVPELWSGFSLEGGADINAELLFSPAFSFLGGIGTHPEDVAHMKRTADRLFGDQYYWSVLGAGRNQLPIATQSVALGGNVRVGLEDSLWIGPGQLAESNAQQVTNVRKIIEGLGHDYPPQLWERWVELVGSFVASVSLPT